MEGAKEKQAAAFYSILAAVFLITAKTVVGLLTGSLALLTDAVHSLLDMGASIITLFAVRYSDRPADMDHHYGHGKIESLGALAQILFLLTACGGIIYEAMHRLQMRQHVVDLNIWAFLVVLMSISIDYTRVRVLRRAAQKYSSQALAADALHFASDIYVSTVVLFGLAAVKLGFPMADPLAAIIVSLFIIFIAFRLGRRSVDILLDRAPAETETIIRDTIKGFPDILDIAKLRLRSDGRLTFAELALSVDRALTFGRADELGGHLKNELQKRLPRVDVVFTLTPASAESEKTADTVRFVVSSFDLTLHHLIINETSDGIFISMHVEMPGSITLDEAHRRAGEISARLHQSIDHLKKTVIHTEPYHHPEPNAAVAPLDLGALRKEVKTIVESFPGVDDCHNIILTSLANGLALSADMRMDGSYTLDRAHHTSELVEKRLRHEIPDLASITLHLEPLASAPSSPPVR